MKKVIKIEGMHCSHCTARVEKALSALGLTVSVDLNAGCAEVFAEQLPDDSVLRDAVEDLGFEVVSVE